MINFLGCYTVVGEPRQAVYVLALEPGAGYSEACTRAKVQQSLSIIIRGAASVRT